MQFLKNLGGGVGGAKSSAPPAKASYFSSLKLEYLVVDGGIRSRSRPLRNREGKARSQGHQRGSFHKDSH
jgi:hypothetical protein